MITDTPLNKYSWFAIQTRSRHEKVVRRQLELRNVEHFLPPTRRFSQWSDRKKQVEVPLFAGYCFARFSLAERLPVFRSQGIVGVVGPGGRPESIPDDEIESLRRLIHSTSDYICHPYLREGMSVRVVHGPLEGMRGRLIRQARHCRLVLGVMLILRSVSIEIEADSVVPV